MPYPRVLFWSVPCWGRSSRNASYGGRSTAPRLRWYSRLWRVAFVAIVCALGLLNLLAERIVSEALDKTRHYSAMERYQRLTLAGAIFPLDRNIRWVGETFARDYNALVIRKSKEQADADKR